MQLKMNTRSNGGYYGRYNHYKPIQILISDWSVNYDACIAYPVSGDMDTEHTVQPCTHYQLNATLDGN